MNIEKNLIMIKEEDKTEKIQFCQYKKIVEKFEVTFNDGRVEYHDSDEIYWFKTPIEMDIDKKGIYENDRQVINVKKVIKFGTYYRVILKNGQNRVYEKNEVEFEESVLNEAEVNNRFLQLKSSIIKSKDITKEERKAIINEFNSINYVSPKSALAYYLEGSNEKLLTSNTIIYPFGFSIAQINKLENVFNEKITIVENLDKEECINVILNIIANVIIKDKSIAVVSKDNSYIEKVYERLAKYDLSFIVAALGVKKDSEPYICNQSCAYTDMSEWRIKSSIQKVLYENIETSKENIIKVIKIQNDLAEKKVNLGKLKEEKIQYKNEHNFNSGINIKFKNLKKTVDFLDELNNKEINNFSKLEKLKYLYKYGVNDLKFYDNSLGEIIAYLECLIYESKVNDLEQQINCIYKELEAFNIYNKIDDYCENTMNLFKSKIAKRYSYNKIRPVYINDDLQKNFQKIIKEFPVILSTTNSINKCIPENFMFDYLVIEDGSHSNSVELIKIIASARNIVVVG